MSDSKLNILIVLPCYSIVWGGPGRVVHDICEGLSSKYSFTILTTYYSLSDKIYPIPNGVKYVAFPMLSPVSKFWRSYNPSISNWLRDNIDDFDLLHIHELWLYTHFVSARLAFKRNIPYVVTPHGELDNWRLNHKWIRKRIFSLLFQTKMLRRAACVHALTKFEKLAIEKMTGKNNLIEIIPNSIPKSTFSVVNSNYVKRDRPYILFMSRIQVVKGCLELIIAYSKWQGNTLYDLIIAGEFEGEDYKRRIKQYIDSNDLKEKIIFVGVVTGSSKYRWIQEAYLFVLPSFSEGFSIAILEAMQIGCPLLVSRNIGIQDVLEENGAAFLCDSTPESVLCGLNTFLFSDHQQILEMAGRSQQVFEKYYSMEKVLESYIRLYDKYAKKVDDLG